MVAAGRALLYLHGGGYITHDMSTSRQLFGHLAKAARAAALIPDYQPAGRKTRSRRRSNPPSRPTAPPRRRVRRRADGVR
jgi:hypothetical protein